MHEAGERLSCDYHPGSALVSNGVRNKMKNSGADTNGPRNSQKKKRREKTKKGKKRKSKGDCENTQEWNMRITSHRRVRSYR
jgi:hypothetical protein